MISSRRKGLLILLAVPVFLVAAIVIAQLQPSVQAQDASAAQDKRTITVSGVGEITVEPDVAYVNLGVLTKGKTAEEAQSENAVIYERLNKVLTEEFKVKDEDIKTVGLYVRPDYTYEENREAKISGYTATHSIRITYRDLDRIGELIDATVKAGVNQVNNVQFATEKSTEHELEAIKLAMNNARKKAEVLAAAEGHTLKGAINIVHNSGGAGIYYGRSVSYALDAVESVATTTVHPGEIVISTSVTVIYEF